MIGLIAFLQALPEFLKLMNRMGDLLDRFVKWSHDNNVSGWIDSLEQSINKLEQAKTPEDKLNAAHDLVGLIRGVS